MAVWRLQVNTGGTNVADYCLKNHVAAMGWSLRELTQAERSGIHTFLDYCKLATTQYKLFDSVCRMVEDVKEGDLLWMRSRNEGKYYIARVKVNSTWVFREDAVQMDAANQLTNIDWYPATDKADEESVPGAVATSFIKGSTIQRIKKNGVEEYSQMLYNRVHDSALDLFNYPDPALSLCEKHFYSLLQPEDVEDLLALWLYDTKGYVCIPSTNKIATLKYECVLVDPNDLNRKHIYIQVKKGDVDCINRREFAICTEKTCHSIGDFPPPRRPPFHQKALPAIPPTELGDTNLLLQILEYCTAVTFFPKAQCAATACGFQHPSRGTFR